MSKRITLPAVVALALILATVPLVGAAPEHADPDWDVSYWNNTTLTGSAAIARTEVNVDYDWGAGSPVSGVNADNFSARWSRYVEFTAGTYRFSATADDGIRVFLDSELILNDWSDHAARTVTADRTLAAGHHLITVEYYEKAGNAVANFSWSPVTVITNWRGEYFNNTALSGAPVLVRDDATVNFDWGSAAPATGVNSDGFSARWTRALALAAGTYRFTATVDDGVRLYVNGHLLIDSWQVQAARAFTGDIYVPGSVEVKMEYYDNSGNAVAKLSWAAVGSTTPPPATDPAGTVIIDNGDAGFVSGGSITSWRTQAEGYNGDLQWTKNNDKVRENYNWSRWYPSLTAGRRYEVYVYIPYRYTTTTNARYWISHQGGYTLMEVDQSVYNNQWVSLGTYTFSGDSGDYISLSDITYETYLSRLIAWDAVKFVPR